MNSKENSLIAIIGILTALLLGVYIVFFMPKPTDNKAVTE